MRLLYRLPTYFKQAIITNALVMHVLCALYSRDGGLFSFVRVLSRAIGNDALPIYNNSRDDC